MLNAKVIRQNEHTEMCSLSGKGSELIELDYFSNMALNLHL